MNKIKYKSFSGEFFCDIPGYEGIYMISNFGTVVLKESFIVRRPSFDRYGYLKLKLSKNGISKTLYIHRVVGNIFCLNVHRKPQLNHLDGVKINCSWGNLGWCTASENVRHAIDTGLVDFSLRKNSHIPKYTKLTREQVMAIRVRLLNGEKMTDIAKDYPVGADAIRAIKTGKSWKYK